MKKRNYLARYQPNQPIPQSAPLPGQTPNSAGGFTWQVSHWERLRRFLILGNEGGSYYASEQALTVQNAQAVMACIHEDGVRAVAEIVAISDEGRAPKNDPAIFALALAAAAPDESTRQAALQALPKVCRIGTHLFTFAEFVKGQRGWGRALRRSIGDWYMALEPRTLAYQTVKYRQRNGWTHTDLLRLAHPKAEDTVKNAIFHWVTKREEAAWAHGETAPEHEAMAYIWAFEQAQQTQDVLTLVDLINTYDLPREALPTEALTHPEIWAALLQKMPMTAMIRNLGTMGRVGLLTAHSYAEMLIEKRLTDATLLHKARVHPIALLSALRVYRLGYSLKGRAGRLAHYGAVPSQEAEWQPTPRILDALDTAFELSFKAVEPTGKRTMLALDVSGSMSMGMMAGVPGLTPRDGSAAMMMVTARTEPNYSVMAFQDKMVPLNISAKMRLDDVIKAISDLPFGATDCAQPMLYALVKKMPIDTFVVYTDSETWAGKIHPAEALRDYRQKMGIDARLVVVGMVSNGFSIADPNDKGMLDVVGFDTAAPAVIADFSAGKI